LKISTALLMSGSLLGLALPMAHAGDEPLPSALPQGYDVMTLSRGPSKSRSMKSGFKGKGLAW
jgi:hypothetical protein